MMTDIRTERGRLIGRFDEQAGLLYIKDGHKLTQIEVPPNGLRLRYTPGDGIAEEVYIPQREDKPHIA